MQFKQEKFFSGKAVIEVGSSMPMQSKCTGASDLIVSFFTWPLPILPRYCSQFSNVLLWISSWLRKSPCKIHIRGDNCIWPSCKLYERAGQLGAVAYWKFSPWHCHSVEMRMPGNWGAFHRITKMALFLVTSILSNVIDQVYFLM